MKPNCTPDSSGSIFRSLKSLNLVYDFYLSFSLARDESREAELCRPASSGGADLDHSRNARLAPPAVEGTPALMAGLGRSASNEDGESLADGPNHPRGRAGL